MYVIAIHDISDPTRFFGTAPAMPDGVTLHSVMPNDGGSRAVCVWQADSVDEVERLVEGTVGDYSRNQYFQVDAQNAQGLPA
jgi:hypothetical protein